MSPSISRIFLFLFLRLIVTRSLNVEESSKTADQLLEDSLKRFPRDSMDVSPIWMEYEFNSGVGNREELIVTDISIQEFTNLPKGVNWQFFEINGTSYLACAKTSSLSLYKLDLDNVKVINNVDINIRGNILTFKMINLNSFNVVAVLCVESSNGTSLQWYRLVDEVSFQFFWSWPVQKQVQDMEFVQQGDENKLLLLDAEEVLFGQEYSSVDVYGFSIDFPNYDFTFWLYQSTLVPKAFDIQVCSIYESISLALRGVNDVRLYEYKATTVESIFQGLQTIKSHDLSNFVCFDSGYLQFLAISGPEAGLFNWIEGEFRYNTDSESNFDISEISWVKNIRLNTYRDEALLLLQLQNKTMIALAWQGLSFERIQLPSNILDQFDLSTITPVPKFGFFVGDQFVRFHTELKELKHPVQYTTEKLLILQRLLNDTLYHQEKILDETEARIEKSYLKNPVTGFWNLSSVNATDANISDDVKFHSVTIGSKNLTREELDFNVNAYTEELKNLEEKLNEIDSNIMNAAGLNLKELHFDSDVELFGNINITGSLNVDDLSVQFINDINVMDSFESYNENKIFSSIEADNLTIRSLNGIPVDKLRFSDSTYNFHNVNFSKINRVQIDGHLFFSTINGVDWETLMKNIVWINQPASIPGNTVIEGTLTADSLDLDIVNGLLYPDDYVLIHGDNSVNVTGIKSFDKLMLPRLQEVNTLNGIDFQDFIFLNRDNVLKEEITFENLSVDGQLQIDGEVSGFEGKGIKLLNETSEAFTDVTFLNLNVLGNVTFETLFMNKRSLNFGDLLLRTEENVEITGTKTFLSDVHMKANVTITSGIVNGHLLNEFVTLNTEQELPNLVRILPNVTFGNVTFGALKKLETLFKENSNTSNNCLDKIIVFKSPITVDELSFNKLNNEISYEDFQGKLNETFQNILLENLTTDRLFADYITPTFINGIDFANFTKSLSSPKIVNEYEIDRLETDHLNATFINGMSLDEINELNDRLTTMFTEIFSGNVALESLQVTGNIEANSVNGKALEDLYNEYQTGKIIFEEDVSIRNLTILGLMNGLNFSEFVSDTILKTDTNIVIDGHKTFDVVNCAQLEAASINGRPVENLFDPVKEQTLTGPVIIDGSITVLNEFNATGRINNLSFHDLMDRFKSLGNDTFELHGDVYFNNNVTLKRLHINGSIQGENFDSFLNTVVFKNEDNVIISGRKVFENSVTFNRGFIVHDQLNDIDLKRFQEKAVFIDKPFSIKSKIIFIDGIKVENDIAVKTNFEPKSIMGINIEDLRINVLYLNRPTYITDPITVTDVNFLSDIIVEKFNNIDMNLLIPLNTEQTIPTETLMCQTVNVEEIDILGMINGQDLKEIQRTTFMVNGNQNITGHFNFHGHVHMQHDFNAHLINGIDPTRMISLKSKSKIIGNFTFEEPIYLNKSLRVLGYLNDIDPVRWEAMAVTTNSSQQQIVSGTWTVHGNVYFEKGAFGSDILNGTDITKISNTLAEKHLEMDAVLAEKNENLKSVCEDLRHLKHYAEKQIYQFKTFDYLQIIEFDSNIVSVHYFELDHLDYMMLSFNTCHMHTYMFTGTKFELVAKVENFGVVERWSTFRYNETLYFLTSGSNSCGRSPVNLWKLENGEFTHVLDLGHNVDSRKINEDIFLMLVNRNEQMRSSKETNEILEKSLSSLADDQVKIVLEDQMLLSSKPEIYEYNVARFANNSLQKSVKRAEVLNFKAGALEKKILLYYDEEISEDRVFICKNGETRKKIVQTINAHRPTFFTILNFEGSIETLLIFIENRMHLQIYEYRGIQGFVYKDSLKMDVDKLFSFKIRKYANLAKRHCLALIHDNRLTILEAEMYGEKLDMEEFSCLDKYQ
nr:uncharacterized protein LOC117600218 [Osmia lignaria]